MPHAALWVVQPNHLYNKILREWFQCRTRLCGWCSTIGQNPSWKIRLFQCRTRLCGWCSRNESRCSLCRFCVSMPHAALWVVQRSKRKWILAGTICFNAARGFVGGAACKGRSFRERDSVSMPHAALWVVQHPGCTQGVLPSLCFNAARGFVGGAASIPAAFDTQRSMFQCRTRLCGWCSMSFDDFLLDEREFQCRTRLCGWCSSKCYEKFRRGGSFNAARGFVGGAALFIHCISFCAS